MDVLLFRCSNLQNTCMPRDMKNLKIFDAIERINSDNCWIGSYRQYFDRYQSKKIYSKFKHKNESSTIWAHYYSIAQKFISTYPSIFFYDKKIPDYYKNVFLSAFLIRMEPELAANIIEKEGGPDMSYSFIDIDMFKLHNNTKNIEINKLNISLGYRDSANKANGLIGAGPCGVGELLAALVELADRALPEIGTEQILAALIDKTQKKNKLKEKYLNVLSDAFSVKGISKIKKAIEPVRSYEKMTLQIWEQEVLWMLKNRFCYAMDISHKNLNEFSSEKLMFFLVKLAINGTKISSYIGWNFEEIKENFYKKAIPFQLKFQDLKSAVDSVFEQSKLDLFNGINTGWAKEWDRQISKLNYRIRYMNISEKTRRLLKDSAKASIILNGNRDFLDSENDIHSPIIDLFLSMKERHINDNEIRNIIGKIYDLKRFVNANGLTYELHDMHQAYLPVLRKLLLDLPKNILYKNFYNKLVKLLVSELGSGEINTQTIRALGKILPESISAIYEEDFNSLSELIGISSYPKSVEKNANQLIEDLKIKRVTNQKDFNSKILKMNLGSNIEKILDNYAKCNNHESLLFQPIITTKGKLSIGLIPHNYDLSLLSVGVNGVCIAAGGKSHAEHHTKECINLIVFDEGEIYLWGLLVKAKEKYKWFLNNFQGRIPKRYTNFKEDIKNECLSIMSEVGDIYMDTHYFNAMDLHGGLKATDIEHLHLPLMRLDVYHRKNDKVMIKGFYELPMKQGSKNAIK